MPLLFYAPFLLYARTLKKYSDSSRLVAFVRGGSDDEMKPKTCMLRHFRMSKKPTFSFCTWTSEVTCGILPPDN